MSGIGASRGRLYLPATCNVDNEASHYIDGQNSIWNRCENDWESISHYDKVYCERSPENCHRESIERNISRQNDCNDAGKWVLLQN